MMFPNIQSISMWEGGITWTLGEAWCDDFYYSFSTTLDGQVTTAYMHKSQGRRGHTIFPLDVKSTYFDYGKANVFKSYVPTPLEIINGY